MTTLNANFLNYDIKSFNVINEQLCINTYNSGPIKITPEGLTLKLSSITNAMLYGEIANNKLENEYIQSDGTIPFVNRLDMNNHRITGLMPGINYNDAINKQQLDQLATNIKNTLDPVLVVSVDPITLSNFQTIDGILVHSGDRVLVTAQLDANDNGVYIVSSSTWIRAPDVSIGYDMNGKFIMVLAGILYHSTGWLCSNKTNPAIVGTNELEINQFTDINNVQYLFGLVFNTNTNELRVYTQDLIDDGLIITPTKKIKLKIADTSLYVDTNGVKINIDHGFKLTMDGLSIGLADGFEFIDNKLTFKSNIPLRLNQTGLSLLYNYEFEINDNKLSIKCGSGLSKDATGIHIITGNGLTVNPNISLTSLLTNWDLGGLNTIVNVKDPVNDMDITNKRWVENSILLSEESQSIHRETFILSSIDINNKYVELTQIPISQASINLMVIEAPLQFYNIDFKQDIVNLKKIRWDGLGLDGKVAVDDKIIISY